MILAGDIGGTNTRIAVFDDGTNLRTIAQERFPSRDYPSLDAVVQRFRQLHGMPIVAACFGVAGPVKDGRCDATNLPWIVDAARGPGTDFLDVPPALAVAVYGVTIRARRGLYTPGTTNQGITILGDDGALFDTGAFAPRPPFRVTGLAAFGTLGEPVGPMTTGRGRLGRPRGTNV